ncbi:N-alpha-acetyltransferase 30 [Eucyclogobius newberryi]|uniref:N-alpha-acetyltransferase 30 n=1 Tax=Eucyclogobius newberryi TaxID=166745 RepID=UPI003B591C16
MATVPPGPSSAVPSSPAQAAHFPGAGGSEPGTGDGDPACHLSDCAPDTGHRPLSAADVKKSVKKKQTNMLARASPALHLPLQSREQQLNGLSSPAEDTDGPLPEDRPDKPRTTVDNGDSGGPELYPGIRSRSEHCQHEGHGPASTNGQAPVNSSMNGIPAFTRTEDLGPEPQTQSPGPLRDCAGTGPREPPAAELSRLSLCDPVPCDPEPHGIRYVRYESELQMPWIMRLITKDLSEPYSIYTYRYFIHNWPQLCFLAMVGQECVGAIVCKLDMHKKMFRRGYIAMLAVDSKHRRKSIGTNLVKKAIYAMVEGDCDEVVLETEITNKSALKLYENLGFVRDKRLFRYYLNGVDALRLKLWLR